MTGSANKSRRLENGCGITAQDHVWCKRLPGDVPSSNTMGFDGAAKTEGGIWKAVSSNISILPGKKICSDSDRQASRLIGAAGQRTWGCLRRPLAAAQGGCSMASGRPCIHFATNATDDGWVSGGVFGTSLHTRLRYFVFRYTIACPRSGFCNMLTCGARALSRTGAERLEDNSLSEGEGLL